MLRGTLHEEKRSASRLRTIERPKRLGAPFRERQTQVSGRTTRDSWWRLVTWRDLSTATEARTQDQTTDRGRVDLRVEGRMSGGSWEDRGELRGEGGRAVMMGLDGDG
jgi:hypothetical protein